MTAKEFRGARVCSSAAEPCVRLQVGTESLPYRDGALVAQSRGRALRSDHMGGGRISAPRATRRSTLEARAPCKAIACRRLCPPPHVKAHDKLSSLHCRNPNHTWPEPAADGGRATAVEGEGEAADAGEGDGAAPPPPLVWTPVRVSTTSDAASRAADSASGAAACRRGTEWAGAATHRRGSRLWQAAATGCSEGTARCCRWLW